MDIRSLTPPQIRDLDVGTGGAFLAVLHEHMIVGPFIDADVSVDFLGRGFRIDLVFGRGIDGHMGRMVTLVIGDAHDLPEAARMGLLIIQVECFEEGMRERRKRSDARVAKALGEEVARSRG